ncbi:MAG: phosphopantothenoylcysteine decarboxylase, partial [Hespellia sp.]|nr:phosphopantothenoylcysteine decarboxylase [Hespellia sp.]
KADQVLCGFSMETQDILENSIQKLEKKNADLIAANSLNEPGTGFGTDTNHLTLIGQDGIKDLPMLSKENAAEVLLDELLKLWKKKRKEA